MKNGCNYCNDRYIVNEVDDKGRPHHVHYCNDCVKRCSNRMCLSRGEFLLVTKFLPNRSSAGFLDWQRTATERHGPLGILKGRDSFVDECMICRPFYEKPELPPLAVEETPNQNEVEDQDVFARLERLLAAG